MPVSVRTELSFQPVALHFAVGVLLGRSLLRHTQPLPIGVHALQLPAERRHLLLRPLRRSFRPSSDHSTTKNRTCLCARRGGGGDQ